MYLSDLVKLSRLLVFLTTFHAVVAILPQHDEIKKEPSINVDLQRRQYASVETTPAADQWLTTATIGGQNVLLLVDTGSSSLWVLDPQLASSTGHTSYDFTKSPTAKASQDVTFGAGYGDDAGVFGFSVADTVSIGGVTLENFTFGVVNASSQGFFQQPYDGIGGLMYTPPNTTFSQPTIFEAIMPTLESPVFALDFAARTNISDNLASIEIGSTDPGRYSGHLSTAPVNATTREWVVDDVDYSVGGLRMNISQSLFFDTGGERTISAPLSVVQEFYSQAEQSFTVDGCLIVPCNATLPDLELHIGNGTAIIYSRDLVGNPYQNGSTGHCFAVLQPTTPIGAALIGSPFFEHFYIVFNQGEPSISYAPFA